MWGGQGGKRGWCEWDQEQEGKGGRLRSQEPEQQGSKRDEGLWEEGGGEGRGEEGTGEEGTGEQGSETLGGKGECGSEWEWGRRWH